jgi:murein DD-endopeptidase MepM/ murein hydrolase activator NlpD
LRKSSILAKRRVPIIIISGVFFILSLVILMNLERPSGASKSGNSTPVSDSSAPDSPASEPAVANDSPPADASKAPETAVMNPVEPDAGAAASTPPAATPETVPAITPAPIAPTPPPTATPQPSGFGAVSEADLISLKMKNLLIPVAGVNVNQLRDCFNDGRSEGRQHQALDIMASQGTPVLAATDGPVAKLFQSDKGGITLYQLDSSGLYYFYYAHLMSYAEGITEGKQLKRGDVIGYVGDTGNAGAGNFHLHFAISKPSAPGKWSGGEPINPYPLLARKE